MTKTELEFGLIPRQVVADLQDIGNWKASCFFSICSQLVKGMLYTSSGLWEVGCLLHRNPMPLSRSSSSYFHVVQLVIVDVYPRKQASKLNTFPRALRQA